eukprot:scaffold52497_cov69-Phaeocystis_antarctica.AAC.1
MLFVQCVCSACAVRVHVHCMCMCMCMCTANARGAQRMHHTVMVRSAEPTCSIPMSSQHTPHRSTSRRIAVSAMVTTSSSSSHADHSRIIRPSVYLPGTPCAASSSAASTACLRTESTIDSRGVPRRATCCYLAACLGLPPGAEGGVEQPGKWDGRMWHCCHRTAHFNQLRVPRRVDLKRVNARVARGASVGHARQGNGLGCGTRFGRPVCELQPSCRGRSTHRGCPRADWSCSREPRRAGVARVAQPLKRSARGLRTRVALEQDGAHLSGVCTRRLGRDRIAVASEGQS